MRKVAQSNMSSTMPGQLWKENHDTFGFIKARQKMIETMNTLGIKNVLLGTEKLPDNTAITNRAPNELSFYQSQQTFKYNRKVEQAADLNNSLYREDPSLVYAHRAELLEITNAGLIIDHTLLIIPPVPAGSVNIHPSIREMFNRKVMHAKTVAERGVALGGIFIENAAQAILTTVQIREIAMEYAKLEMRADLPDAAANIETIKQNLSIDQINDAMSKFSSSESTKEESTNRLKLTNSQAQHFFDVCLGAALTASICDQEIKEQKWNEAWTKFNLHFTKQTTSSHASKRLEEELQALSYNDARKYSSQTIDHFMQELLEIEVQVQIAFQQSELHPPTQIVHPAIVPTAIPADIWHMKYEDLMREIHLLSDNQIQANHPNSILYRRKAQRYNTVLDKLAPPGSLNETFKNSFLEEVNDNKTEPTIKNFVERLKFMEKLRPTNKQQLTTTLLIKSKVVAVNNIKTDAKTPAQKQEQTAQEKMLCKTCKKFRPDKVTYYNRDLLTMHSHQTEDCRHPHGAMNKNSPHKRAKIEVKANSNNEPDNKKDSEEDADTEATEDSNISGDSQQSDGNDSDSSTREIESKRRKLQQLCMRDLANKFKISDNENNRYKCIYGAECTFRHLADRREVGTKLEALRYIQRSRTKDETLRSKLCEAIRAATALPK